MPRKVAGCPRPAPSCARCRAKKIKCDKGNPCSQCVSAYAKCSGIKIHGTEEDVPRSLIQFLRGDIERIERKINGYSVPVLANANATTLPTHSRPLGGHHLDSPYPPPLPTVARQSWRSVSAADLIRRQARQCASMQKLIGSVAPSRSSASEIPRTMMSLTSSRVFASTGTQQQGDEEEADLLAPSVEQTDEILISVKNLALMPVHIVRTLVRVFVEKVHSLLPMVHAPTLWDQVDRVLRVIHEDGLTSVLADYDFLVVHVVLAISVSLGSASSGHGPQRMAFSQSLFQDGIKHLSKPTVFPSAMSELQVTLLMLHYGTINPRCASVWMLSGSAMRLCLKLGLHRELEEPDSLTGLSADMRRRLFWLSYCFDRHVCAALQYPISLSDAAINTTDFSALDDKNFFAEPDFSGDRARSKEPALHWLEYRQIHSDMVEVHFRGKSFGDSWENWLSEMEAKLRRWYDKHCETYAWTETAYHNALTYLHRPSPLTPKPAPRSLLIAFENACAVASSYDKDIQAGYFRRPWLAAHHTFGSAAIVLFCLRHGSEAILTKFSPHEISSMTGLFSLNLQSVSWQIWPEVSRYLEVYNRLLEPLTTAILSGNDPSLTFDQKQDEELAHLLYPGTTSFEAASWTNVPSGLQWPTDAEMAAAVEVFDWDFSRFDDFVWDETTFNFLDGTSQTSDFTEPFLVA